MFSARKNKNYGYKVAEKKWEREHNDNGHKSQSAKDVLKAENETLSSAAMASLSAFKASLAD